MFLTLLIVTFVVATVVSCLVAFAFRRPAAQIMQRIIADDISAVWARYLMFALFVVGISSGVRIRDLEKYITKPAEEHAELVQLTSERWVLELYRTIIETLQGLAWALLVFFVCSLFAFVMVRLLELRKGRPAGTTAGADI